jgi:hypothetical protein
MFIVASPGSQSIVRLVACAFGGSDFRNRFYVRVDSAKKKPAGRSVAGKGDSEGRSVDPPREVPGIRSPGAPKGSDHAACGTYTFCELFQGGLLRA